MSDPSAQQLPRGHPGWPGGRGGMGGGLQGPSGGPNEGTASGAPGSLTSYTLPGVLHFLQVEWRRFERERNEWEIERADLKARVAFLEGERRGTENLKTDLMRRVKMLEFALRQERSKFTKLQSEKQSSSPLPGEQAQSTGAPNAQTVGTHTSTEAPMHTLPDAVLAAPSSYGTLNLSAGSGTLLNYSKGYGHVRSKEILKNYLREMGFLLTSSGVGAGSGGGDNKSDSGGDNQGGGSFKMESPALRREPNRGHASPAFPPANDKPQDSAPVAEPLQRGITKTKVIKKQQQPSENAVSPPNTNQQAVASVMDSATSEPKEIAAGSQESSQPPASKSKDDQHPLKSSPTKNKIPKREAAPTSNNINAKDEHGQLTADEMQELKLTPDKLSKVMRKMEGKGPQSKKKSLASADSTKLSSGIPSVIGNAMGLDGDALANLSLNDDDTDEGTKKKGSKKVNNQRIWRPKAVLRNHLDSIRAIAFSPKDSLLMTASEDNTAKLWNLGKLDQGAKSSADVEPIYTFRGHSEPVISLAISADGETCYTGSVDATIRAWQMPAASRETYASYENSKQYKLHTYVGHSDVIWDLKLHPLPQQSPSLASVSSDGSLKIWNTTPDEYSLRTTMWYGGASHGGGAAGEDESDTSGLQNPTSVDWLPTNLNKLAVSYQNSVVKIFDAETGQQVLVCKSNESFDGTVNTQINKIVAHPLLPLLITAHEDRFIRIFDVNTGAMIHSMVAHQDSVSALDISSDGLTLVSGGHDCSLRWWDLSTRKCVQEYTSHRKKNDEGIWAAKFHPEQPHTMASGGADSI
ncbi:hypothetical protein PhCBS80983_g03447 [Powellomyces hirtus]|uniref:Striatin N-terminal domain-containing protein n=1 Tax=Powellomyces hirtus TaxID=109895 RepID=A0A507E1L3_9FUNG|nr:hypothetical protein PhCBS80983_g03447 [Powellomyces hirtus]